MKKPVNITFTDEADAIYNLLKVNAEKYKQDRILFDAIEKIKEVIKKNPFYGNLIPKKQIPKYYKEKYGVKSLFRIELPLFWRMIYTVKDNEIEIVSFILEIFDHKKYNRRFGYRNK